MNHISDTLRLLAEQFAQLEARMAAIEQQQQPEQRERLNAKEAADLLGLAKATVHRRASQGTIPTRGHSPRWYSRSELEAWDAAGRPEDVAKWRAETHAF